MATPKLRALADLRARIEAAADAYYNAEPTITDAEFDALMERMRKESPGDPVLSKVGALPQTGKVKLPYPMMSLDKIKGSAALERWASKQTPPFVLSDKLDGTSALMTYERAPGGWKVRMFRRGTGTIGADVTHLVEHLVPEHLSSIADGPPLSVTGYSGDTYAVRGEIIMRKHDFKGFSDDFKDARCLVNSLVNRKDLGGSKAVLDASAFVAYELVHPRIPKLQQMVALQSAGFEVVPFVTRDTLTFDDLGDLFVSRRAVSPFNVDGVVMEGSGIHGLVAGKNPGYAAAFKMDVEEQGGQTTVVEVTYEASKDGLLIPRVKYDPVVVNGVTLQWATGFNARFIRDSGIGPGAKIEVIRSGEVIPKIVSVLRPVSPVMPSVPYEWDPNEVHVRLTDPGSDPDVVVKRIVKFFTVMGIENLKEGLVRRFYEEGFRDVKRYLIATEAEFLAMSGVSDVLARKLFNNIQAGIRGVDPVKLMCASNVFGAGVGENKLKAVLQAHPDMLTRIPTVAQLCGVESFQEKTAVKVHAGISAFQRWHSEHKEITVLNPSPPGISRNARLVGQVIVFSGFRDNALQERIEHAGGVVAPNVTRATTLVVATGDSGKVKKARELGIRVVAPADVQF